MWSDAKRDRLRDLYTTSSLSTAEITGIINSEYGSSHSVPTIVVYASRNKMQRPGRAPTVWSPDKDELLSRSIEQGKSFSQIGLLLGMTRNAISGRATRLGLSLPMEISLQERAFARALREHKKDQARIATRLAELLDWVPGKYRQETLFARTPEVVSDPRNLSLAEIGMHQCRWIMNDDCAAPLYCGHATTRKSWCAKHAGVVFL